MLFLPSSLMVHTINGFQNCSDHRADWFIFRKKIPGRLIRDMRLTTSR